jgi:hypothetical protein
MGALPNEAPGALFFWENKVREIDPDPLASREVKESADEPTCKQADLMASPLVYMSARFPLKDAHDRVATAAKEVMDALTDEDHLGAAVGTLVGDIRRLRCSSLKRFSPSGATISW